MFQRLLPKIIHYPPGSASEMEIKAFGKGKKVEKGRDVHLIRKPAEYECRVVGVIGEQKATESS
jgi:hypothetical protein